MAAKLDNSIFCRVGNAHPADEETDCFVVIPETLDAKVAKKNRKRCVLYIKYPVIFLKNSVFLALNSH